MWKHGSTPYVSPFSMWSRHTAHASRERCVAEALTPHGCVCEISARRGAEGSGPCVRGRGGGVATKAPGGKRAPVKASSTSWLPDGMSMPSAHATVVNRSEVDFDTVFRELSPFSSYNMSVRVADIEAACSHDELKSIVLQLYHRQEKNVPKIVGRIVRRVCADTGDTRAARALAMALLPAADAAAGGTLHARECASVMDAFEKVFGDPDASVLDVKITPRHNE